MKRTITIWLGVLALAIAPLAAQQPAKPTGAASATGKIHGKITNPVGTAQGAGTVSLSTGPGQDKFTFTVDANGSYTGEAAPGTYVAIYRDKDTPKEKEIDHIADVKIVAGQDIEENFDMTREAYIKSLPPDVQKQLEEIKKKNADALKTNVVIKQFNADLAVVLQDIKDADAAQAAATQQLGAGATKQAVDEKTAEIKTAKYTDVETLMTKDTQAAGDRTDVSILWARLGQAKVGLKKYDEAEPILKKTLELDAASKKPNPEVDGLVQSELGAIYARTGKVPEANAAYDAAAAANPKAAQLYYRNQAIIFFQVNNTTAQVAAADKAIANAPNDPASALLYYIKASGLVVNATVDPKTNRIVLPDGCAEAYQRYLDLAPTGQFAADAKGVLESAGQKIQSTYKAGKKS
jgi:tetratricopeptide (TPR) repeat protein